MSTVINAAPSQTPGIASAVAGAEAWLETIRDEDGHYGPVIGFRNTSMAYCGPGFDWRYEALLDAAIAMHRATRDGAYLDRIEQDLSVLAAAQLENGAFRNSYFEFNPFEGGMPHEPAALAAACRALRYLKKAGRGVPSGIARSIEFYIERRLLKELWNKLLQTFNDWETSEFTDYAPCSVAAAMELLMGYAACAGTWEKVERYVSGAAASLVRAQQSAGVLDGAMPLTQRNRNAASVDLAARCVPALVEAHKRLDDASLQQAADKLNRFLERNAALDGPAPRLVFASRPASFLPFFPGAFAGTLLCRLRAGFMTQADVAPHVARALEYALPSGAFRTAEGFGALRTPKAPPDWRDIMPVCGWTAKLYALLAELHPPQRATRLVKTVRLPVRVRRRQGVFIEDDATLRIEDARGKPLYHWVKKQRWPQECAL